MSRELSSQPLPRLAWRGPPAWNGTTFREDLGLLLLGTRDATKEGLSNALDYLATLVRKLYEAPREDEQLREARITVPDANLQVEPFILLPLWQTPPERRRPLPCTPNHLSYLEELRDDWRRMRHKLDEALPEPTGPYSLGWGYAFSFEGETGLLYLHHGTSLGKQWVLEVHHHPRAPTWLKQTLLEQRIPTPEEYAQIINKS